MFMAAVIMCQLDPGYEQILHLNTATHLNGGQHVASDVIQLTKLTNV